MFVELPLRLLDEIDCVLLVNHILPFVSLETNASFYESLCFRAMKTQPPNSSSIYVSLSSYIYQSVCPLWSGLSFTVAIDVLCLPPSLRSLSL